jgi:hypothetical protein
MGGQLADELLPDHPGGAEHADVDSLGLHHLLPRKEHQKKTRRPGARAGGCCDRVALSLRHELTHTGGLRIRFVRFRQTVWRVVQVVTIVRPV